MKKPKKENRSPEGLRKLRKSMKYRSCAGIALFNRQGQVWLGHRVKGNDPKLSSDISENDKLWQLPQGGIDKGEKPLKAAKRELWEETGVTNTRKIARIDGWLKYELPDELLGKGLKGKYRGQQLAWFAFLYEGDGSDINILEPPDGMPVEFDEWRWATLEDIPKTIVEFKKPIYRKVVKKFAHLPEQIRAGKFD